VVRESPGLVGEGLSLVASHGKLTTRVTTRCALVFATQPHNAIVGQHITGADFDRSGPPVTVEVVDAHGRIVDSSTARTRRSSRGRDGPPAARLVSKLRGDRNFDPLRALLGYGTKGAVHHDPCHHHHI
jgi:hypothetical protein